MIIPHEFFLLFGERLNPENRWCKLVALIPWDMVENNYAKSFKNLKHGNEEFSVRIALGSFIIQNHEAFSDKKLLTNIAENPYMQCFIGLHAFVEKPPFDSSLLVHFRKRLGKDIINEINEIVAKLDISKDDDDNDTSGGSSMSNDSQTSDEEVAETKNLGKLILDATCTPADVHYPTDIWLLNEVREALEESIDVLHSLNVGTYQKPRTYRDCARRAYLNIDKKKRPTAKEIRKDVGQQLRYIHRDLDIIEKMADCSSLPLLIYISTGTSWYRMKSIASSYKCNLKKDHKIEDRIVSLHMPFIRPIVRGKANAAVEFGAKLSSVLWRDSLIWKSSALIPIMKVSP